MTFEELEENKSNEEWLLEHSYSMEYVMKEYSRIDLKQNRLNYFINGGLIEVSSINKDLYLEDGVYNVYSNDYIGIGIVNDNVLKRDVVLK